MKEIEKDFDPEEELKEPHHFGSHNIYIPHAPIGQILQYYPWDRLFSTLPFEVGYPQVLYTDHRADALFESMSMRLAALVPDPNVNIEVSLQYPPEESSESAREGYLTIILRDPLLAERTEGLPMEVTTDLWLDLLAMSVLQMMLQTEMDDEEHIEVALVEIPSGDDVDETTGDLMPEWVALHEEIRNKELRTDGFERYRYGFRLERI